MLPFLLMDCVLPFSLSQMLRDKTVSLWSFINEQVRQEGSQRK